MSDEPDNGADLGPREQRLGEELVTQRPVPSAGFRGALGRRLIADDPGYGPRPERLVLAVAALLAPGLVLIALGALAASGSL